MDFEQLQKIWIADTQETVYAINEKALHSRVSSKRNTIQHIANTSEWMLIIVNFLSAVFILAVTGWESKNVLLYIMAAWMLVTAAYVLIRRVRRLNETPKFDRSVLDELRYAITTAGYQVRLSQLMRLNVIPIGVLSVLGLWYAHKPLWISAVILVFFAITYYASGWEHAIYKRKKRELEVLQSRLEN